MSFLVDPFVQHFADPQPKEFEEQIARVEQKKWDTEAFEDDIFGNVLSYSVGRINGSIRKGPRIKDLTQTFVKSRVARQWKKTNSNCVPRKYGKLLGKRVFTLVIINILTAKKNNSEIIYGTPGPIVPAHDWLSRHSVLQSQYQERRRDTKCVCPSCVQSYSKVSVCDYREKGSFFRLTKSVGRVIGSWDITRSLNGHRSRIKISGKNEWWSDIRERGWFLSSEIRDQGFTRPKVLIVLPFRNTVVDVVNKLIKLSGREQQVYSIVYHSA